MIQKDKDNWLEKGNEQYQAHRYIEALDAFEQAIHLASSEAIGYVGKGRTLFALKRYKEASEIFRRAIRLDPRQVEPHHLLGNALFQLGHFQAACRAYTTVLFLLPNYSEAYNYRGLTFAHMQQYKAAVADFNAAIRLDPNYITAHVNKAEMHLHLGQLKTACKAHQRARYLLDQAGDTYKKREKILAVLDKQRCTFYQIDQMVKSSERSRREKEKKIRKQAERLLTQTEPASINTSREISPSAFKKALGDPLCQEGDKFLNMRHYHSALSAYERAIVEDPQNAYAHRGASFAWHALGEEEKALSEWLKAVKYGL
jgi:tetratricopeptide (TPR) repeat protein